MDTPKNWYNTVKHIKTELEERKKNGKFHPLNIKIGEQVDEILQLFNECEFVGFPKENPETSIIILNTMEAVQKSVPNDLDFMPDHPFFNLYIDLCFLRKVLDIIKYEYEINLCVTIEHLENLIYQNEDYQNLMEVSRKIGRKVINKQYHPNFALLKEHIDEQLKYIDRKKSLNSFPKLENKIKVNKLADIITYPNNVNRVESQFSILEWATIFYYADETKLLPENRLTKVRLEMFMDTHQINTTLDNFRTKYYDAKKRINKKNNYPINKLELIIPFLKKNYKQTVTRIENDIIFLKENDSEY
ncbi:hypothetical protein [Chryseobacterium binzhouense]|uniref:hypothetical protein n=1 Tax=Chryseobacterium binzhouense TaxID=2593646 RepID=UPI0028978A7E|nr:hypothetical protein [Chryseobacterium binzhouense]